MALVDEILTKGQPTRRRQPQARYWRNTLRGRIDPLFILRRQVRLAEPNNYQEAQAVLERTREPKDKLRSHHHKRL